MNSVHAFCPMVSRERVKIKNLKPIQHKAFVAAVAISSSMAECASVEIYIVDIVFECLIQMGETRRKRYLAGQKLTLVVACPVTS